VRTHVFRRVRLTGAVTLSIGVAPFRNGESVDLPLLRADATPYSAKQGGRNRVETSR
jgi:PleD family two-component response regulator